MSDQIIPFRFGDTSVRTIQIDGEPWFVAADIAELLGSKAASGITRMVDDEDKGFHKVVTPGGEQTLVIINESGLFTALLRSNHPSAKAIRRWVTSEVLPAIRKTGSYTAQAAPLSELDIIKQQHGAISILLEHNERMAVEVATLTPSAEAWNELVSAKGDYDVAEAAKILAHAGISTGQQRLFEFMREIRWTFRAPHGKWEPYSDAVDNGYLAMKPQSHFHPGTGEKVIDPPQVRVTLKGVERLRVRMTSTLKAVTA